MLIGKYSSSAHELLLPFLLVNLISHVPCWSCRPAACAPGRSPRAAPSRAVPRSAVPAVTRAGGPRASGTSTWGAGVLPCRVTVPSGRGRPHGSFPDPRRRLAAALVSRPAAGTRRTYEQAQRTSPTLSGTDLPGLFEVVRASTRAR